MVGDSDAVFDWRSTQTDQERWQIQLSLKLNSILISAESFTVIDCIFSVFLLFLNLINQLYFFDLSVKQFLKISRKIMFRFSFQNLLTPLSLKSCWIEDLDSRQQIGVSDNSFSAARPRRSGIK